MTTACKHPKPLESLSLMLAAWDFLKLQTEMFCWSWMHVAAVSQQQIFVEVVGNLSICSVQHICCRMSTS